MKLIKTMKYKVEEINIGDEVIFRSTKIKSNNDLYWEVTGKNKNRITIKLNKFGIEDYWTIDILEVVNVIKKK